MIAAGSVDPATSRPASSTSPMTFGSVRSGGDHSGPPRNAAWSRAALTTNGNARQLAFYLDVTRQDGNTEVELVEALTHLAFYAD